MTPENEKLVVELKSMVGVLEIPTARRALTAPAIPAEAAAKAGDIHRTPKVDPAVKYVADSSLLGGTVTPVVHADLARQLERDLAARAAELVKAQQQVEYLNTVVLGLGQEKVDFRAQLQTAIERADSLERECEKLNAENNRQAEKIGQATRGMEWQPGFKKLQADLQAARAEVTQWRERAEKLDKLLGGTCGCVRYSGLSYLSAQREGGK